MLNEQWRIQAIKDHPQHKESILTLNRYARERDLVNAILQIIHDTFPLGVSVPVNQSPPNVDSSRPAPEGMAAISLQDKDAQENEERFTRCRLNAGDHFDRRFTCPCGRSFKYEKAYKTHQESCPACRQSGNGPRGRKEGETFLAQFQCPCGRIFKYEKANLNHKNSCMG